MSPGEQNSAPTAHIGVNLSMGLVFTPLFLMLLRFGGGSQAYRQTSTSLNTSSRKGPDL